ncbi:MAG: hypothetical protein QOJ12_748 [Thermoleophilales bacterium]|nr:hypothetical protein [Thermoleophilales bacterium]
MIHDQTQSVYAERPGVLQAIARAPRLVVVPMVVLAALGAGLGYARSPNYTATSEESVGPLDISNPAAIGSVVQASQQLAAVYSRAIRSNAVRRDVARAVPRAAPTSLSATPVPASPLIRISATSDDSKSAVAVANAASRALIAYAVRNTQTGDIEAVQKRFRAAALSVVEQQRTVQRIGATYRRAPTSANRSQLDGARANAEAAVLKREALRQQYQTIQQTLRTSPVLQSFNGAAGATSDRLRAVQILALIGLVAGGAAGAALATSLLNRRIARLPRS